MTKFKDNGNNMDTYTLHQKRQVQLLGDIIEESMLREYESHKKYSQQNGQ